MNLALTGATGFLGSHLCRSLCSRGHNVTALVRSTSRTERLPSSSSLNAVVEVDRPGWTEQLASLRPEAVIHVATNYGRGEAPLSSLAADNIVYPLQVLEAAKRGGALRLTINTDSFFTKPRAENNYLPGYCFSKRAFAQALTIEGDNPVVSLRLEHLYGPDDSSGKFIPWLLANLRTGKEIALSDGEQVRDFIFIDDAVEAFVTVLSVAADFPPGYHEFEVGTGVGTTLRKFIERAHAIAGSRSVLNFGAVPRQLGELSASTANISPLRNLGWAPRVTAEAGIAACVGKF